MIAMMHRTGLLALAFVAIFSWTAADAATRFSVVASGNWSATSTWGTACGGAGGASVPAGNDRAVICNGTTVILDTNTASLNDLNVNTGGTLTDDGVAGRTLNSAGGAGADITNTGTINFRSGTTIRLAGNTTWTGTGTWTLGAIDLATRTLGFTGSAFTINLSAATPIANPGTLTDPGFVLTWNFNGTVAQTLPASTSVGYGRITINNTAGVTLGVALSATNISGNLDVQTGTLNNGGFAIALASGSSFSVSNGATFRMTGTAGMVTVSGGGTKTFGTTLPGCSTVDYAGTNQTVSADSYGYLTLSNSGTKTMPAAAMTVACDFTMSGTASAATGAGITVGRDFTLGAGTSFGGGTFTHAVGRNFTNNGATFTANTSTFNFNGSSAQAIGGTASTSFSSLTDSNTSAAVTANVNFNVSGTLNMNGANTLLTPLAAVVINNAGAAGTITGTGTVQVTRIAATADFSSQYKFTTNTLTNLTVEYIGAAAQIVNALTYGGLKINNASGVTLAGNATVNTLLTFANGKITTGANSVIVGTAGTIASPSATSYVVGNYQKNYSAGANLSYFVGGDFPVGDASNYTPVDITAGTTTTAGTLTVSTLTPDHPQVTTPIASTGIDAARSVNRYWRFNNSGLTVGTAISATFTFVAGDLDPGPPNTANFIVERYDGTNWSPTTLVAANPLNTQASNITPLVTGNNDFAIGEPLFGVTSVPGLYNVFETSTPVGSVLGKIQTKVSGVGFSVDVVHLNPGKTGVQAGAITVEIRLLDSSSGGALDVNGCNAAWPLIQAAPNFNIPASGRGTIPAVTVGNSYRSVRVQVRSPVGGAYTQIGCSNDLFAIRPQSITISGLDATWQTAGTTRTLNNVGAIGGVVHAASDPAASTPRPFTLRATPVPATATNYDGSPTVVATYPTCGTLCTTVGALSFTAGSWTAAGSGVRENATAHYSEAGTFNLQLEDGSYASVDAVDGSSSATRTVPITGASSVEIGRFVPDRFVFTAPNTPSLQTFGSACASRSFTYIGQPFWYATATLPSATVNAVNAAGTVTSNYRGTLFKLTGTGFSETYAENGVGRPSINAINTPPAQAAQLLGIGSGTATYKSRDGAASPAPSLFYTRTTASPIPATNVPFTANLSLSVTATDSSENGVAKNPGNVDGTPPLTSTTALVFNGGGPGITFDSGNEFRYGRVRMLNSSGPLTVDIPVTLRAEYYVSAAAGFATNASDNCTSFVPKNFVLSGHQPSLTTLNMVSPTAGTNGNVSSSGTFASGFATTLKLLKPSPAVTTPGAVKICLDLDSAAGVGDLTCQAATPANQSFLQGPWLGSANHDKDPSGQVNLGTYGAQPKNFIFQRENF